MILDFLKNILYQALSFFVSLLPESSGLPAQAETVVDFLITNAQGWNDVLPISDLFLILSFVLTYEAGLIVFHLIRYIIKLVRGHG